MGETPLRAGPECVIRQGYENKEKKDAATLSESSASVGKRLARRANCARPIRSQNRPFFR